MFDSGCAVCQNSLHGTEIEAGRLLMRFPTPHTRARAVATLDGKAASARGDRLILDIDVRDAEDAAASASSVARALSPRERRDTRVFIVPDARAIEPVEYLGAVTLENFLARLQGPWVAEMIANNAFTSVFQPIVRIGGGSVFAYECLLRGLRGGERIAPTEIIEAADAADLLTAFDHAARSSAVRAIARHPQVPIAFINVSPRAIYDSESCLMPTVAEIDRIGFPHERVVFEVIESDYADPEVLAQIFSFYRSLGFGVALDDIGTGFASLSLLNALRPDFIKLDLAFVRDVDSDPYKGAIVEKLIETAHALDIQSVAEGIETEAERDWLHDHGADLAQGYFYAKPADVPPLIERVVQAR